MKKIIKIFGEPRIPKISMIVFSYKNLFFLNRFFCNIITLRASSPVEIIFVDDGTLGAFSVYDDMINKFHNSIMKSSVYKITVLIKEINLGISDSAVRGIKESSGSFINFKSVDDLYVKGVNWDAFLREFVDGIEVLHFPFYWLNDEDNFISKKYCWHNPFLYLNNSGQFFFLKGKNAFILGACLIRSSLLKRHDFFSLVNKFKYTFEWPLFLYISSKKIKIKNSIGNDAIYIYIRNKESISNWLFKSKTLRDEHILVRSIFKDKSGVFADLFRSFVFLVVRVYSGALFKFGKKKLSQIDKKIIFSSKDFFDTKNKNACDV